MHTMAWIALSILMAGLIALVIALLLCSPGEPRPLLDDQGQLLAGSLSEKVRVKINGVEQGMIIKSTDVRHPVLLFLHGGPWHCPRHF